MTRIIAGRAGGRRLRTPAGSGTRPTSERVREALFSALAARGALAGARVLDLYAGSGALGLEAASRGAAAVTLVESDRRVCTLVTGNARDLGLAQARVVASTVESYLRTGGTAYDVVLLDPPYAVREDALAAVLQALVVGGWVADGGHVVVERSSRSPEPAWPAGLVAETLRTYGETALWYATTA